MRFRKLLLISVAFIAFVGAANAQVPAASAQAPNLKVGVVTPICSSTRRPASQKLVAALRTLETEFKPRRDDSPPCNAFRTLPEAADCECCRSSSSSRARRAQALQIEIRRKQEDARVAYGRRFSTLTDPIRL
jgi:hypothetical protein